MRRCSIYGNLPLLLALCGSWLSAAVAVNPPARRRTGGRSTVTHYFKNPRSLCLSYGCGSASMAFGGGGADSVAQPCSHCKTVEYHLPQTVKSYCLPHGAGGGRYLIPPGWTLLASASWLSEDNHVDRDVTVAATPAEWTIHGKLASANGAVVDGIMDLAGCKGLDETDDSQVEIMMVAFAGSPSEVGNEMKPRRKTARTHGIIEFEPHIALDTFKAKTFQAAKKDGFVKAHYRKIAEKVNVFKRTRKRLGSRVAASNFKPNSGFVVGTTHVMDVSELEHAQPDMMFGMHMTCKSKQCDVSNFFGCYHIMCRRATAVDLAMPAVYEDLKEQYLTEMEQQLAAHEQLLENERLKAEEEADLEERKREQEELNAKHKAAVEFMKRNRQTGPAAPPPQNPAFANLPHGAVPLGAYSLK